MTNHSSKPGEPTVGMVAVLWIGGLAPIVLMTAAVVSKGALIGGLLIGASAIVWTAVCWYGVATGRVRGRKQKPLFNSQ